MNLNYFAIFALLPSVAATFLRDRKLSASCVTRIIDFEGYSAGDIVSDLGGGVSVQGTIPSPSDIGNRAMIFDTAVATGGDTDLTANGDIGNVLILAEDNPDVEENPDDNKKGGRFTFTFDSPTTIKSIEFLDIEETGGFVKNFGDDGPYFKVDIPAGDDGSLQTVIVNQAGVKEMRVRLKGSGAIPRIEIEECGCPPTVDVACAKCGQILECYIDGLTNENTDNILAYLNGPNFCKDNGRTPTGQQCAQKQGLVLYDADEIGSTCPLLGSFQCKGGAARGGPAALSNWATHQLQIDCDGEVTQISSSAKCDSGLCGCDFGNDVFCATCDA